MKSKKKISLIIVSLNILLVFVLISTFSTPVKAEPDQWQYQHYVCIFQDEWGQYILGARYVCELGGNQWLCYEVWPDIPCGPVILPLPD